MKRYLSMILIVILLLLNVACTVLFSKGQTVRDPEKYLQVASYVQEELDSYFAGFLMEESRLNPELAEYYYHAASSFSDPHFIIHLVYRFDSEAFFEQEWTRINDLAKAQKQINANRILYTARLSTKDIEHYLDDEINDGRFFCFEFALVDQSSMTITYLSALVQDNQTKENVVLEIINLWEDEL